MKEILLLLTILSGFSTFAQVNFPNEVDTTSTAKHTLYVNGQFDLQSTSVRREVFNTLIWGGYIDDEMKQRSFDQHDDVNRFGLASNNELIYQNRTSCSFQRPNLNWGVKAGYAAVGAFSYGTDAYGLTFYGNEMYLGDTADFSNTRFKFMQFQKVGFGFISKTNGSNLFLNVVNVQQSAEMNLRKGQMYQNDDASEVDVMLAGDLRSTYGNDFSKGIGVCLDGTFRVAAGTYSGKTATMEITFSNIGFAYLYAGQFSYQVDSTYNYTGFELNQLTSDASPFNRSDFSVMDSLGISADTVKRTVLLPGYIQIGNAVDFRSPKMVQPYFGVRLYPTLNIVPSIFAGVCYKPIEQLMVSGSASYGGFGNFRAGFGVSYQTPMARVTLATDDVISLVSNQGFGQSLILRTVWNFGQ